MKSNFVNGSELARLCEVSRQAVDAARQAGKLHRDEVTKKYDLTHPVNAAYYEISTVQNTTKAAQAPADDLPADLKDLAAEKLRHEVRRIKQAADKLEIANEKEKGNLIDAEMISVYLSAYATANRDYFLPLGKSLAKGDIELQTRIEAAVTKALKKTQEAAADAVKEYVKVIIEMKEVQNAEID